MEKTFTNGSKSTKFVKVFSLESFPLYGMYNLRLFFFLSCRSVLTEFPHDLAQFHLVAINNLFRAAVLLLDCGTLIAKQVFKIPRVYDTVETKLL